MKTETGFIESGDRYRFDFKECTPDKGWAQIDTNQDAWYFGQWANPTTLEIVAYVEGDYKKRTAESKEEFVEAIRGIQEFHNTYDKFIGIDPMLREPIKQAFQDLGLGDLLH